MSLFIRLCSKGFKTLCYWIVPNNKHLDFIVCQRDGFIYSACLYHLLFDQIKIGLHYNIS